MNSRGSILIWTVFLGLFIAVFFITFQSRLEQYFSNIRSEATTTAENLALQESLDSLKQLPQASIQLSDTKQIESTDFDGSAYTTTLPAERAIEFRITNPGSATSIEVSSLEGGPIRYVVADVEHDLVVASGAMFSAGSITIANSTAEIVYIENLGGYAKVSLKKWPTDLLPTRTHYHLVEKRGDLTKETGQYTIEHFSPEKAFPAAINKYNTYGMYLTAKTYEP